MIFAFSAHAGGSQTAFELAEQMAERNVPDSRIMNVINLPGPATTLSLEEQQIEQSLQRLDDRLLTLQESLLKLTQRCPTLNSWYIIQGLFPDLALCKTSL